MKEKKNNLHQSRCACLHLRKASRAVSQFYDRYLQPAGIRGTQYSMLLHIANIDNIAMGELSERLCMDQSTATRGVDILYKMGLVAYAASPEDGRKKVLTLTPKGVAKTQEAEPFWTQAQKKIEKALKSDHLDQLLKLLEQVTEITK